MLIFRLVLPPYKTRSIASVLIINVLPVDAGRTFFRDFTQKQGQLLSGVLQSIALIKNMVFIYNFTVEYLSLLSVLY